MRWMGRGLTQTQYHQPGSPELPAFSMRSPSPFLLFKSKKLYRHNSERTDAPSRTYPHTLQM